MTAKQISPNLFSLRIYKGVVIHRVNGMSWEAVKLENGLDVSFAILMEYENSIHGKWFQFLYNGVPYQVLRAYAAATELWLEALPEAM